MFELVGFVVHVIRGVLSWSLHVALLVYFAAILPQAVMGLVKAVLAFKQFLRKQAIEAVLNANGLTSEFVLEKLKELEEFRLLAGDEVATVRFDPDNTVMIAFGSGYFDTIPNHKLVRGDAPAIDEAEEGVVALETPTEQSVVEAEGLANGEQATGLNGESGVSHDLQPEEEAHVVQH